MNSLRLSSEEVKTAPTARDTQEALLSVMHPDDLIIVLGGDGTVNTAVSAMMQTDPDHRGVLLPARAGTANDFVRSHYGKMSRENAMTRTVTKGNVVDIHPMEITVTSGDFADTRLAVNNAGFGYSGHLSRLLNEPWHRNSWLKQIPVIGQRAQEARVFFRSTQNLIAFKSTMAGETNPQDMLDLSLTHARKAAKYGRFAIDHMQPEFLHTQTEKPSRRTVVRAGRQAMLGTLAGERLDEVSLTVHSSVQGHVDGEPFDIAAGSLVHVALAETSFQAYSLTAKQ